VAKITQTPGPGRKSIEAAIAQGKVVGKVGWFPGAMYKTAKGTIPVATVAVKNEYGEPEQNIPPRPFFRPTVANKQNEWKQVSALGAKAVLNGSMTQVEAMEMLALQAEGDVVATMARLTSPALAESTIYRRQHRKSDPNTSDKPLNDRGYMIATLTHQVEET
jgi:hypothetical protein